MKIAYVVSRFPSVTEAFVLDELLALEGLGLEVELYPLLLHEPSVQHPDARAMGGRTRHRPRLSLGVLATSAAVCVRRPLATARAVRRILASAWPSPGQLARRMLSIPQAVAYSNDMRGRGVEHVHAHFADRPAQVAWLVHELTGIPFSFTARGPDLLADPRGAGPKIAAASFAFTVSEASRDLLAERLGERASAGLEVHRYGVDTELFRSGRGSREELGMGLRILCVASLREDKGHVHLIAACGRLQRRGIAFECRLVGDGPGRAALERAIDRAGLTDEVLLLGRAIRPKLIDHLAWADVLVQCSVPDRDGSAGGLPLPLIEGMACSLPVVASRLPITLELVDDGVTGFLTPPGDADAIARALADLATDPELRARLGAAGREVVLARYDLRRRAADLATRIQRGRDPARRLTAT